ncbi:S41 family peptidase [Pedobacter sp.]|uniref:S41 family peptidase n=1 Tax=Pedobacter sp. TaxID=1411316 RepID=UPI002CB2EB1C|nr:S41 family peptidase [Pedobacter sp.]HWW42491.1 S41 family peptidase [Pedobacter sp.]
MQKDLAILWAAIQEMHPAYGIYTTPRQLKAIYKSTCSSITRPLSENDFITRIYPFLCALKCGHTQLKHSTEFDPSKEPKEPPLPFQVLVRNHRAWVTTYRTDKLHTGDEIININDIPTSDIIRHGYDLYCGDGYNETFKELFLSEYDGFEDVCSKYYHWKAPYRLLVRNNQGKTKTVQIVSITQNTTLKPEQKQAPEQKNWTEATNTDYLPLRFSNTSSTAWFEVKTFQYADTLIYEQAFKQIRMKGIKNLIIDLRHNTGGDIRIAAKLLSYLADSSFHIIKEIRSRIPDPAINPFENYFDADRTESFKLGFKPGPKEGNGYHIDFRPVFGLSYQALPVNPLWHFKGKLFVLIDGATFSSGAHAAAAIKAQCKTAKFIGRETAGTEEGCSGGTIQHLTLPNTHIVVEFPWMRVVSVAKNPVFGHGIFPDYAVSYSPDDIINKRDPDIKKALSLLQ